MSTTIAGFRTRKPGVNIGNNLALLFGNPFQNLQELSERQIVYLPSPQSLHSFQIQRLKAQHIKPVCQHMCQLPAPIRAAVNHVLMSSSQVQPSPLSICRTIIFARELPRCFFNLIERLLQELGRFNLGAIRTSEESFQPKIKASNSTWLNFDYGFRTVNYYDHKQLTQRRPFNRHSLDDSLNLSTIPILINPVPNLYAVAAQEFVACLLQRERLVPSDLLKTWWQSSLTVYTIMKKRLDFRVEDRELEILEAYCKVGGRTKTDVIRELIRSLAKKKPS